MNPTPTPALRSAIKDVLKEYAYTKAMPPEAALDKIMAIVMAPCLAPAPVEQARGEPEIIIVVKEQLAKAEMWEKHYKTDPEGKLDEAFWQGRARGLAEILDYATRHFSSLATENKDSERLDWLDAHIGYLELKVGREGTIRQHIDQARASAGKGETP